VKVSNFLIMAALAVLILLVIFGFGREDGPSDYDAFAQCLAEKGVKMYGAYWCGHCNSQKEMFGDSWKYMDYVECSLPGGAGQTQECADAGIRGYPTWEFPGGKRLSGEISFPDISANSGCELS
jgi:hypothetical protein